MKRSSLTKIIAFLLITMISMLAYLVFKIASTNKEPITTPNITSKIETPDPNSDRAFITIGRKAQSVKSGSSWTVEITSNTWSKCISDIYDPEGIVHIATSPADAEALIITPGKFQWTWNVPREAKKGIWTIRLLCGTFENLATQEVSIRVE